MLVLRTHDGLVHTGIRSWQQQDECRDGQQASKEEKAYSDGASSMSGHPIAASGKLRRAETRVRNKLSS